MGNGTGFIVVLVGCGLGCAMERDRGPVLPRDPAAPAPVAVQDRVPPRLGDRGSGGGAPAYAEPLLPISGGTLLVTRDGRWAVMSDPDEDLVRVVDLDALEPHRDLSLAAGDEPGRLAEDAEGRVHVALRTAGAIASFAPEDGEPSRRAVCAAPRGIAYEEGLDSLHVACAGGELVTLPASGGLPTRTVRLDPDLRDVVVHRGRLYVSRFRSAEVLAVSAEGVLEECLDHPQLSVSGASFQAAVAWRMVASSEGPLLSYQRVLTSTVDTRPGGYGIAAAGCTDPILHTGLARVSGSAYVPLRGLGHGTLPVDLAVAPDGTEVALAFAGNTASGIVHTAPPVGVYEAARLDGFDGDDPCAAPVQRPGLLGRAVAVAYDPLGRLAIQVHAPPQLVVLANDVNPGGVVRLGERRPTEPGHFFFHAATPSGLACASCHPEGADDGFVWRFAVTGARRTQPLWGGLLATAPFHWDGTVESMAQIVDSTFTDRMSGPELDPAELAGLERFIDAIEPPTIAPPTDPGAVARGQALFVSELLACSDCHAGAMGTDSRSHPVRGFTMQTPALVGLLTRAPYMHDGCAPNLHEAVLACGYPSTHGGAALLSPDQLSDLVAYLETR